MEANFRWKMRIRCDWVIKTHTEKCFFVKCAHISVIKGESYKGKGKMKNSRKVKEESQKEKRQTS